LNGREDFMMREWRGNGFFIRGRLGEGDLEGWIFIGKKEKLYKCNLCLYDLFYFILLKDNNRND
jgi:hypothetical protein